jgi:hypothetical protein
VEQYNSVNQYNSVKQYNNVIIMASTSLSFKPIEAVWTEVRQKDSSILMGPDGYPLRLKNR